jgi:protein-tyrosine-phosphatase
MNPAEARPLRICLVCTGNTCRSAMSEGILKALAAQQGLDRWRIESGGLHAFAGAPATTHAVQAAAEHDIDISGHRARLFDPRRAAACDLILVHSGEHLHRIAAWGPELEQKTFLLKSFPTPGDAGPDAWVADPIGQELDRYRATFLELDEVLRRIVPRVRAWAGGKE